MVDREGLSQARGTFLGSAFVEVCLVQACSASPGQIALRPPALGSAASGPRHRFGSFGSALAGTAPVRPGSGMRG